MTPELKPDLNQVWPTVDSRPELDLNLDDENEAPEFIATHGNARGLELAQRLGLTGPGAAHTSNELMRYAHNRVAAFSCRKRGDIAMAFGYEAECDRIYKALPTGIRW